MYDFSVALISAMAILKYVNLKGLAHAELAWTFIVLCAIIM